VATTTTMLYRQLDENWDFTFGRGKTNYISNKYAVAQAIKSRLRLLLYEWWLEPSDGLPLWQKILGKRNPKSMIDGIIQERILGTTNVRKIDYMDSTYNPDTREYTFYCVVETVFGQTIITNRQEA
jgi:hypothetical protein